MRHCCCCCCLHVKGLCPLAAHCAPQRRHPALGAAGFVSARQWRLVQHSHAAAFDDPGLQDAPQGLCAACSHLCCGPDRWRHGSWQEHRPGDHRQGRVLVPGAPSGPCCHEGCRSVICSCLETLLHACAAVHARRLGETSRVSALSRPPGGSARRPHWARSARCATRSTQHAAAGGLRRPGRLQGSRGRARAGAALMLCSRLGAWLVIAPRQAATIDDANAWKTFLRTGNDSAAAET